MRNPTAMLSLALIVFGLAHAAPALAKRPGTHFLAELDGGAVLTGNGGPAARVAFGAGAKLKRFPARFYLLGQFAASSYQADAPSELSPWSGVEEGSFDDLALGPRVYLPIVGPLRFFVEGMFGATLASGSYVEAGLLPLEGDQWVALALVSTGVQLRLLHELSIGLRAGFAFNATGLTGIARVAGIHDDVRPTLTGGVTWHF